MEGAVYEYAKFSPQYKGNLSKILEELSFITFLLLTSADKKKRKGSLGKLSRNQNQRKKIYSIFTRGTFSRSEGSSKK